MSTPSAALTTLAILAALVTLGASDRKQKEPELLPYEVILHKGDVGSELDESRGPFNIPDGQCSGVLDEELTCNGGRPPIAVRITVQDGAPYPMVAIQDTLQRANVVRKGCLGLATVSLRLACSYSSDK